MKNYKNFRSKIFSKEEFYRNLPAKNILSSNWKNITLNEFQYSSYLISTPAPATSYHAFSVVQSGHVIGNCSINGKRSKNIHLRKKSTVIVPAFHDISWEWSPIENNCINRKSILIHFSNNLLKDIIVTSIDKEPESIELTPKLDFSDSFLYEVVSHLKRQLLSNNLLGQIYIDTAIQILALHLLSHYSTIKYHTPKFNNLSQRNLKQILDYCHDYYNHEISLSDLATIAHLSESHFLRVFKKATGKTPTQYIIECRMERAKILLKTTALSVLAIGLEVGYNSPSHFIGLFKRYTGATPHQYRQAVQ